ncbi:NlpC/P60 family protein [Tsukamurella sp. 1534]|uniref:NlpC/P60 family protein n=1 Tax=Tsukamurella sp. 1534 TaxID=1151061 RepID=UPI0006ACB787|nr:NlpC/P60 family protein [Tsukamurella sp. 1534]
MIITALVIVSPAPVQARHIATDPGAGHPVAVVPTLIVRVADLEQQIAALQDDVDVRRQSVNKAAIDVAVSADAARAAGNAVIVADREVAAADRGVADAQRELDTMIRALYVQGNVTGGLADAVTAPDGPTALDRTAILRRLASERARTVIRMTESRRRAELSRSAARAAKIAVDATTGAAADRRRQAETSVAITLERLRRASDQRRQLSTRRTVAARALEQAKAASDDPASQQRIYDQFVVAEQQSVPVTSAPPASQAAATTGAVTAAPGNAASSLLGQLTSLFGIGAPVPQAQTAPPATATTPTAPVSASSMTGQQMIEAVIGRGLSVVGTRYSWGGGDINGATVGVRDGGVADSFRDFEIPGFDCSGLTLFAFAAVGIKLPHYSGYQYNIGMRVPLSQMKRGDMIFFGPNASQHEALYLGDNQMLEAPESGSTVKVSPLRTAGAMPYAVRLINS